MLKLSLGRLVLLACTLAFVTPVPAQEEGASLREIQVQEILASCEGRDIPAIWRLSDQLVGLGPVTRRAIQRGIKDGPVESRLCGLRALVKLGSPTYAVEKLMDLALEEKNDLEFRLAAVEIVGLTDEIDAEDGLAELLVAFEPRLRIAAARALWNLDSEKSNLGKKALREFLRSPDAELRAKGALALAEMGDSSTPGVMETLLELRKEPGTRGQLADALYKLLNLRRALDLRQIQEEREDAKRRKSGPWAHLDEIREWLKRAYDLPEGVDEEEMRIRAARGLLNIPADPHTQFMTPEEYREFLHGGDGVDPSYGGIGAFIDTNVNDRFRILRPIFGGPAWKADIHGGDDIVAVDGEPTAGRETSEVIKLVKGPPGTPVVLTIFREGWGETRDIKVIRAKIVLPTVYSRMLPGKIGLVEVAHFAEGTGDELKEQIRELEQQGMRGLVLDLRDNPGGLLGSVIDCLSLFLRDRELICSAKGRIYRQEKYYSNRPDLERRYPISVLVNSRSASGAELMSGVLQHYSKTSELSAAEEPYLDALVLGTTTFGKGSMQRTFALQSWPGEKYTDAPRPDGRWDPREKFQDKNGNGVRDEGEPFVDRPFKNGRWDDAEPWEDTNGNGTRDPNEAFTDENGDGIWNPAESFQDSNGNGEYDYGAAVKLSVARYYLPGGRNFTRTREYDAAQRKYRYVGGVKPDLEIEADRMEMPHLVELRDFQQKDVFEKYVTERWDGHKETFRELARFDARDPSAYPDFDAFYAGLNTRLSRQDVRRALRIEVRRAVSVERGKDIPGDLSDDNVLRRGVWQILGRLGAGPRDVAEYAKLEGFVSAK